MCKHNSNNLLKGLSKLYDDYMMSCQTHNLHGIVMQLFNCLELNNRYLCKVSIRLK